MTRIPGTYNLGDVVTKRKGLSVGRSRAFLNFTDKNETEAKDILEEKKDLAELGESYRIDRLKRGQKAQDVRNGKIWNAEDDAFFADLDLTGYEFNVQRPLFNTIVNNWMEQDIRFKVAPKDVHAHHRYVNNKQEFVEEFSKDFGSPEKAAEYFDENVDDEFGIMLSALMMDSRDTSNGEDAENDAFDNGAITGMAGLKVTYSTKYDRSIGLNFESVPQNAIIYDEARNKNYECDDISFIGQVHEYYPEDLIEEYPERAQEIEETYRHLIENRRTFQSTGDASQLWKNWYEFVDGGVSGGSRDLKIKVAELWTRHTEPKIRVIDKQTNKIQVARGGVTFDQVVDKLMSMMAEEAFRQLISDPNFSEQDLQAFQDPKMLKEQFAAQVQQRYEFEQVYEPIWYKTIFTFNGLFEHTRSPYPHGGHPYALYFSQYHHGHHRGMAEDILDVIIAYNKAVAFRELMMAHGAKNVLLVDEDMLAENDIKKEDLADQWTRIGSVIALKLKPGYKLSDVALPVNTVGEQMDKINVIINHYASLMNTIMGVVPEQLGESSADAPASRYNMQLQQGIGNNAVIYKNFYRTLKQLYRKALTMEIELLKVRKERVIRLLGDEYRFFFNSNYLNVQWNDEFALFEETLRSGQYGLKLIPIEDDPQMGAAREGMLFELAGQGAIPVKLAFKYSSWDKRHRFVKDLDEAHREQYLQQLEQQVDIAQLAEIMQTKGVGAEVADEILSEVRLQNIKNLRKSKEGGNQGQSSGNNGRIRELAAKMGQTQRIQNSQQNPQNDERIQSPQQ